MRIALFLTVFCLSVFLFADESSADTADDVANKAKEIFEDAKQVRDTEKQEKSILEKLKGYWLSLKAFVKKKMGDENNAKVKKAMEKAKEMLKQAEQELKTDK
uniref:Replicase polyprotein 1a n=1 Tax=Lygus hesperus TaxID=30085 RepID=A0A0A9YYJ8_LYGHE